MIKIDGKEVEFEKFPNGELKLIHSSIGEISLLPEIHFKFEDNSDLIKLMFVKNYLDQIHAKGTHLFIYYMPYSRMDRSENGSPFTLKYIANFINHLNFNYVNVIEPHSDVTVALLDRANAYYINFDLIEDVKDEIGFDEDNDYIVFPDAGASKRYNKMKAKNVLIGFKHRDFQTGEIKSLELVGDTSKAKGRKAIIVDDLSSYGGTFIHSAEALRAEGFEEIYLLVCHAENSIFKKDLFKHIDKVFTTNTLLTEQNNWENKKFENQLHIFNIEDVLKNG
ncbi:ribose-phosphate pyrophosphokinase [Bacillus glycinifermentans]|uniref:phosphoribosyltransferase family protein n=1 Tax=Bacillus glycinifermentans TaxID=1664069 RepID=UPI00158313C1|nr:phosphoribosyltransferase family protein [Bacillus glycinifermentans]NUJ17440.1 ribose-phosphate pyrophosphokinase [Bacillus glycinifermentans]